jgi:NMD protein affecting ribosome stability and mRNA decay
MPINANECVVCGRECVSENSEMCGVCSLEHDDTNTHHEVVTHVCSECGAHVSDMFWYERTQQCDVCVLY